MPLEGIHVDDKLQFVEEPVEIMEREIKRLKRSRIPLVKVRWNSRRGPEFTWEREDSFKQKYPQLFTNRASSSTTSNYGCGGGAVVREMKSLQNSSLIDVVVLRLFLDIRVSCEEFSRSSIQDSASKISSLLFQRVIVRLDAISSSSSSSSKSTTDCFLVLFCLRLASRGSLACGTLNCGCDDGCGKYCGCDGFCEKYCGCDDCCEKIVVAYFLDSCNFGSRIVNFDDTPIVSDKLDRG
ncbi:hypothetical protein Tco_0860848 [Tanacetum coccineum]|uniref:Reverse transcriptase domain-containing protein n=1 Tax=Tanacetum coccineum TaxID=301880 RepID=A0ABQ5BG39_9ASTR